MSNPSFSDIQKDTRAMIAKIKDSNPELGAYVEVHIIFDEKNETMRYTGDENILREVMSRAVIKE